MHAIVFLGLRELIELRQWKIDMFTRLKKGELPLLSVEEQSYFEAIEEAISESYFTQGRMLDFL